MRVLVITLAVVLAVSLSDELGSPAAFLGGVAVVLVGEWFVAARRT